MGYHANSTTKQKQTKKQKKVNIGAAKKTLEKYICLLHVTR